MQGSLLCSKFKRTKFYTGYIVVLQVSGFELTDQVEVGSFKLVVPRWIGRAVPSPEQEALQPVFHPCKLS
jgi:hypothetical protein